MNSLKLCLIALFFLLGCAKDEKLLVIECFNKDPDKSWDNPVFIWYKSIQGNLLYNSLDGSDGSSTPHQYSDDFKSVFFREFVKEVAVNPNTERREITFDEFKKDLSIKRTWRPLDGEPYYVEPSFYSCKILEDNR